MTIMFFYFIFQTSARFSYVGKVANFFRAGPVVNYVLFLFLWDFIFVLHKDGFNGIGFFEDVLNT